MGIDEIEGRTPEEDDRRLKARPWRRRGPRVRCRLRPQDRSHHRPLPLTGRLPWHHPRRHQRSPLPPEPRLPPSPQPRGLHPPALTRFKNLKYLDISWTNVSGPVPAFLSEIISLTLLDLSFNRLSGSIPACLGDLPNLSSIDISRNHLAGPLPPTLFQGSSQGPYLRVSHNNLTGEIPPAFGKVGFEVIDLWRNRFTGAASVLFDRSKPARQIDLSKNRFAFDLTNVEFPEGLDSVDLNHNMIYGSIPEQITKSANL